MAFGGVALKSVSIFLRFIEFCCAAIIIGIFSYFLAALSNHHVHIDSYLKAVEGISGVGVIYTLVAMVLVCCLGGIAFFSAIGMLLDFCFAGAFAYVAYATRGGRDCTGIVNTPLGSGNVNGNNDVPIADNGRFVRLPSLHFACRLNTVCFAVAIIAAVFFLLSLFVELGLIRHHKKEKAFGPSPNNGYTAGRPKRKFGLPAFGRKNRDAELATGGLAAEKHPDALPSHTEPAAVRDSYATDATRVGQEPAYNKYGPTHPVGTAVPQQQTGYATTTTTHAPHAGANEMSADGYQRTHQPYNANATGNF